MSHPPEIPRYGQPNFEYIKRMSATTPEADGPVYMVNLMKYRVSASYADGNPLGRTGREADDAYAPAEILRDIGAEIVFAADVVRQLEGDATTWDRVAVVKYPTRASFVAMQRRPDFKEKHVHKEAGMEQTIVLSCTPSPVLNAVVTPAPSLVGLRVTNFLPGSSYERAGIPGAVLQVDLVVEAAVVGDGREWKRVRFFALPDATLVDTIEPSESETGGQYTIVLTPERNRITESSRETLAAQDTKTHEH